MRPRRPGVAAQYLTLNAPCRQLIYQITGVSTDPFMNLEARKHTFVVGEEKVVLAFATASGEVSPSKA